MTADTEAYRRLFDSHPVAMAIWDPANGRIIEINDAAVRQYGYDRDEARGMAIDRLVHPDDRPRLRERLATMPPGHAGGETFRHLRRDGSVIEVEMTGNELLFDGRTARVVMALDVSERRRLEEQLLQAQRMEAVGQLAGGIAHDFNNLLMVINGFSELLLGRLPPGDELEAAQQIRTAGERAASLTGQLLAFASPGRAELEVLDLSELVGRVVPALGRALGDHVDIAFSDAATDAWVEGDPAQLEQVLVNLAVNARDAMPGGGRLKIELDDAPRDHPVALPSPNGALLLSVTDTGRGISDELRERVFLPYFTTKADRGNTGLGLATAFATVRACGGHVWVEETPATGTTIRVVLPRAGSPPNAAADAAAERQPPVRRGVVLVAEDQPAVRALIERVLGSAGYDVIAASSALAARDAVESRLDEVDLLVTDAVMPGLAGLELARQLRLERPDLPVLFVSGWPSEALDRAWADEPAVDLLIKPFDIGDLVARVTALVAGRPAERGSPIRQPG